MPLEGEITVRLHWDGKQVQRVGVHSTRPRATARLAIGRPPAEVAKLLPSLFAVCGQAQGAAAAAALCAAGALPDASPDGSPWAVALETVQETLWRLLIDAPRAIGLVPQTSAVAAARQAVARALAALDDSPADPAHVLREAAGALGEMMREHIYGRDSTAWLTETDLTAFDTWRDTAPTLPARTLARLVDTAPGLCRSDTPLMPGWDHAGWWPAVVPALQHDPTFADAPTWGGMPVETGALARMHAQPLVAALIARDGHSAATRITARLVEIAQLLEALRRGDANDAAMWVQAWPLGPGTGLAAVQTARGLLLHQARLANGLVTDYRIVAPTEWNFHPDGALTRGLRGTQSADEAALKALAAIAVHTFDPCVGFRIEVVRDA